MEYVTGSCGGGSVGLTQSTPGNVFPFLPRSDAQRKQLGTHNALRTLSLPARFGSVTIGASRLASSWAMFGSAMRAGVIGYASRNGFVAPGRGNRRSAERKETRRKTHQRIPGPKGYAADFVV